MNSSEHFYETCYQTWMNGGNPDRVDYDRCVDDFHNDKTPEFSTHVELKKQFRNTDNEEDAFLYY